MEPRTVFALGLNYADHAKELAFKAPEEPLAFLKGQIPLSGTGDRQDGLLMHLICIMNVNWQSSSVKGEEHKKEDAFKYVSGYTIANDYAIRDYLENYYRPNLKVKNRDTCTPIGPWLVDAEDIPDPSNLSIKTYVNKKLTQEGNTKDMIFSIADLIEYFSGFMTLSPGDIILTGTPEGLADTAVGDEITTEIEGIGKLVSTIVGDDIFREDGDRSHLNIHN